MQKELEIELQKNIISAYEDVVKTSDDLIKAQKSRIEELEKEVKIHKEAVERLFILLDETISIAKSQIDKNILPTTLN
jgi:hypothetical protein